VGLTPDELAEIRTKYGSEDATKLEVDIKQDTKDLELKLD
jgi:hypothetical protein